MATRLYDRWYKVRDGERVPTKAHGVARRWQLRYTAPDTGRETTETFERKPDAKRRLDEITADIVTGTYVSAAAGRVTFREYAEGWRKAQVHRPSTADKVESVLRLHCYPYFGDLSLAALERSPSRIQSWAKNLSLTLAPASVAVAHGIAASVFKAAIRDRRMTSSPCEDTKLPEVEREPVVPLSTEAVRGLEAAMPNRFRALVTLGAAIGLRISEATGLTVDRSGLKPPSARPMLRVDRQLVVVAGDVYLGPPKRRASRRDIPLPRVAVEALAAHLAAFPPEPRAMTCRDVAGRSTVEEVELLFTTAAGDPLRRNALSRSWRAAVTAAGLPADTTYHSLRHYYASLLIRHGESVKVVQARLGHATAAETLDSYSHLWPDSEDRTRAAVDSVLGVASHDEKGVKGL